VYDIADYFAQRGQQAKVLATIEWAQSLAPQDPLVNYYRAVASIVGKEKLQDAEKLLKQYLEDVPKRAGDPKPWEAHYWLGRAYEAENNTSAARTEYETAVHLNAKYKAAQEALKRLGS
jgi:TolA-binding protein